MKPMIFQLARFSKAFGVGMRVFWLGLLMACGTSSTTAPGIRVENVWSRPAEQDVGRFGSTGVVYLTIVNKGGSADRLLKVQSETAEVAEIHQTTMDGDVMKMAPVKGGLEIPAKSQTDLQPGGVHIMLIGLKRSLNVGDRFELLLEFEKRGKQVVESEVRSP